MGTHPGYDRADQYPPNGQDPEAGLHDLARLQNDPPSRALLRDALLLRVLALPRRRADEPARRLDVRERDHAQRDRQRRRRVRMRERREREERLRVERAVRRLRESRQEHGRAHEHGELRERRDEHRHPGSAAMLSEKPFASRHHLLFCFFCSPQPPPQSPCKKNDQNVE